MNNTRTKRKLPVINEIGKMLPNAVEIEEAVLGAVLLEQDAFLIVNSFLKAEHFYKEQNQLIYKAINDLANANKEIDILTVNQQLIRNKDLEIVGGSFYVSSLTNRIASASNIESHARIVQQKFILRSIIEIGHRTIGKAYSDDADCFDLLEELSTFNNGLLNVVESKQAKSIGAIKDEVIEKCETALITNVASGIPIKIKPLHNLFNGWQKSDLIILAARPGMGKTAVAIDYAYYPATLGIPSAIFSLEMSNRQLVSRLMSKESYISSTKINNSSLNNDELRAVKKDTVKLNSIPMYIDDTPSLSLPRLRSKAIRLVQEHGVQLIIIDYLQLMEGDNNDSFNREQEISKITRGLKRLAKELDIPIIALSQLSRQVENRPGAAKRPQLSDLRESGSIEQDADEVIFLFRPEYYGMQEYDHDGEIINDTRNLLVKIIAKNRHGSTGDIKVKWIGETTSIYNWDPNDEPVNNNSISEVVETNSLQNNTGFLSNNSNINL